MTTPLSVSYRQEPQNPYSLVGAIPAVLSGRKERGVPQGASPSVDRGDSGCQSVRVLRFLRGRIGQYLSRAIQGGER